MATVSSKRVISISSPTTILDRASARLGDLVVAFRAPIIFATLLLTVVSLWIIHKNFFLDPGFEKSIPTNHPFTQVYKEYEAFVGAGNRIIFELRPRRGDIFTPEFMNSLQMATEQIRFMNGVNRSTVKSIFTPNVYYFSVTKDGFRGNRIVPSNFRPSAEGIADVKKNLERSNEIGRLVARNFSGALVVADIYERDLNVNGRLNYWALRKSIDELAGSLGGAGIDTHIIGFPQFITEVMGALQGVSKYFLLSAFVIIILTLAYTGSAAITASVVFVAILSVIWTLAIVALRDVGLDPLSILVPFLTFAIAVSHAVQMTSAWATACQGGLDAAGAARAAFISQFIPGTTALLATGLGFGAVALIRIPVIDQFAALASFSVLVTIITNKIVLPSCLTMLSKRAAYIASQSSNERAMPSTTMRDWLARALPRLNQYIKSRVGATLILVVTATTAVSGFELHDKVVVGDVGRGAPELRSNNKYNVDVREITSRYSLATDEIGIIALPRASNACTDPQTVKAIDDLSWRLTLVPGVISVNSISTLIRTRYMGNSEGFPKFWSLPRDTANLGESLRGVEIMDKYFNQDCSVLPIDCYLQDHDAATVKSVVDAVRRWQSEGTFHDALRVELATGSAGLVAATNEVVKNAEAKINISLFLGVAILCLLTFLSLGATLSVVLPLVAVAYAANIVMVTNGIGLKVATLPCVALGVGIGVDYGIYLISRVLSSQRAGLSRNEAMERALREVGPPVFFTAMTMTAAVFVWYWSPLKLQADMGVMLAYMFSLNAVGGLLVAPCLLNVFKRNNRKSPEGEVV